MELYSSLILGLAVHVQDRWEAVNLERQFQGSHCWDTTLVLLGF